MRDNHKDPRKLTIAGLDVPAEATGGIGVDAASNALSDDSEPIQSIKRGMLTDVGVFGSVTYTKIGNMDVLLLGRKRTRALRLVNDEREAMGLPALKIATEYKALPPEMSSRLLLAEKYRIMENRVRYTSASPLAAVRDAQALVNQGCPLDEIAATMGVTTENAVRRWIKIGELAPKVLEAIENDLISADAALVWHGKSVEKQEALLAKALAVHAAPEEPTPPAAPTASAPAGKTDGKTDGQRPAPAKRRTAKANGDGKAKRITRADAKAAAGESVKRNAGALRRLLALPRANIAGSEDYARGVRAGALWAIGDKTDAEVGFSLKKHESAS